MAEQITMPGCEPRTPPEPTEEERAELERLKAVSMDGAGRDLMRRRPELVESLRERVIAKEAMSRAFAVAFGRGDDAERELEMKALHDDEGDQ